MVVILYRKATGEIIGTTQEPEARVQAWLENCSEVAADTAYLVHDDTVDREQARRLYARDGKFMVRDGVLYDGEMPVSDKETDLDAAKKALAAIDMGKVGTVAQAASAIGEVRAVLGAVMRRL